MRARFQGFTATRPSDQFEAPYQARGDGRRQRDRDLGSLRRQLTSAFKKLGWVKDEGYDDHRRARARHQATINKYSDMREAKAEHKRAKMREEKDQ